MFHRSKALSAYGVSHPTPRGPEADAVRGHDEDARRARVVIKLTDAARIERDGFFDEHMFARSDGGEDEVDMGFSGRADADKLDVASSKEFGNRVGARKRGKKHFRVVACGDEISCGRAASHGIANSANSAMRSARVGGEVRSTHEADADDSDANDARLAGGGDGLVRWQVVHGEGRYTVAA